MPGNRHSYRDIPFKKLEDLNGLRAGAMLGYEYCDELDRAPFTINAQRVNSLELNFKKLLFDRIDFVIEVDAVGFYKAKNMGISNKITSIPNARYCYGGNYLAFAQKDRYDRIALQFGKELRSFKLTEAYKQILRKYGREIN